MASEHSIDEFTLLCGRCGYVIEGLPGDGACPECGKPISESLPEARVGSPWQQGARQSSWVRTASALVRRPRETFDRVRIERVRSDELLLRSLLLAAIIMAAAAGLTTFASMATLGSSARGPRAELWWVGSALFAVFLMVTGTVGALTLLAVLTVVEQAGIRVYGRTRKWRITPDVAFVICSHAAIGWTIGALGMLIGVLGEWAYRQFFGGSGLVTRFLSIPAGFLFAMLCFEILVFIGMRRCKFANRPRPTPSTTPNNPPTDPPMTAA